MDSTTKGIDDYRLSSARIQSEVRSELRALNASTRRFVQERPYTAVLVMAAAGYLLARIVSRY